MEGSDGMTETDGHKDSRNGGGKAWRDEARVRVGMEGREAGWRDGKGSVEGSEEEGEGGRRERVGGARSTPVMELLDHPAFCIHCV